MNTGAISLISELLKYSDDNAYLEDGWDVLKEQHI